MSRVAFLISIFFIVNCFLTNSDATRILAVFPVPSISHQVVFRPLTQELAKRGHQLVIITPDPAFPKGGAPENITEIDLHDESYKMWHDLVAEHIKGGTEKGLDLVIAFKAITTIFDMQINSQKVKDILQSNGKFDLILTEAMARPTLILSHLYPAPLIQVSSFGAVPPLYQIMGSPYHPLHNPEPSRHRIYNMSILEKIFGIFEDLQFRYMISDLEDFDNQYLKKSFGENAPTVSELSNNVEMLFLNLNPVWEGNRAVPPGVIHMGGLHQQPPKKLPEEIKTFLDNSEHGVIYMSFGTNVNPFQLPAEKMQMFPKVFSKLPYDVIWKYDDIQDKPKNVWISNWWPQADILRHPKVKLFITQGGLQSTDEAITGGVPLIAFPMIGDQWYNAEKYVHHDIGMKLDLATLTEEILEESIQNIIKNESYRQNIIGLRDVMHDQPQRPLERAVWWVEYVIRHRGAKLLRSPLANISWTEYLMLDVIGALLGIACIILVIVTTAVNMLYRRFIGHNSKVKRN